MRHVPFIGEELICRDDNDQGEGKRVGQIIDEVLSTAEDSNDGDETAAIPAPGKQARASGSVSRATSRRASSSLGKSIQQINNQAHIDWFLINNGHGLRINISGIMDQGLRQEWMRLLRETADNGINHYEFNLTQAPTLSLTGLALLLLFKEQKKLQKQDIKLYHCNRQIWELLEWAGMDRYFVIQGIDSEKTKPK